MFRHHGIGRATTISLARQTGRQPSEGRARHLVRPAMMRSPAASQGSRS
jgi:hypothetical protein